MKLVIAFITALIVSCAVPYQLGPTGSISVVLATPHSTEATNILVLPTCSEGELCHHYGLDIVTATVDFPVSGPLKSGSLFRASIDSSSVEQGKNKGMHLFVIETIRDKFAVEHKYRYRVIEVYPFVQGTVCIYRSLSTYLQGNHPPKYFEFSDAMPKARSNCYKLEELQKDGAGHA